MDDKPAIGTDLAGLGRIGVQLIQTGEKFLEKLVGPYLQERGELLADAVRARRRANLATIAGIAATHLADADIHQIPGRILFPFLEYASNEESPDLQRMWAALLATAVSQPDSVPPAFPKILSELSPLDVRILQFMHEQFVASGRHPTPVTWSDIVAYANLSFPEKYFSANTGVLVSGSDLGNSIHNLTRLQLISTGLASAFLISSQVMARESAYLTPLGVSLTAACNSLSREST